MKNNKLHIVSLDVPYPADYGGAIDIFYRIKALHELGYEITLHVFEYGRGKQIELDKYATVIYYKRKRSLISAFSTRPFIVQSRKSNELLRNLLKDKAPILFEGLHTTWYLENKEIRERKTIVRTHNIEHEYYIGLKKNSSYFKKLFFKREARKLEKYQDHLKHATFILAIKESDAEHLSKYNPNVYVLPASIPEIKGKFTKVQRYALFHGNLSVPENEKAAIWIIQTLKSVLDPTFPLRIAGKNPGKKLKLLCKQEEIELISNPSEERLFNLIQEAQIHVLYTSVPSGIKLKLLNCLHSTGHILVNSEMVTGTSIEQFCTVAPDSKSYKRHFIGLQNTMLSEDEFEERADFIFRNFNNKKNCKTIRDLLSPD